MGSAIEEEASTRLARFFRGLPLLSDNRLALYELSNALLVIKKRIQIYLEEDRLGSWILLLRAALPADFFERSFCEFNRVICFLAKKICTYSMHTDTHCSRVYLGCFIGF